MPTHCSVVNCYKLHKYKYPKQSSQVHAFPNRLKSPERFAVWVEACGKNKQIAVDPRMCSLHFSRSDYVKKIPGVPGNMRPKLNKFAIPTKFLNLCRTEPPEDVLSDSDDESPTKIIKIETPKVNETFFMPQSSTSTVLANTENPSTSTVSQSFANKKSEWSSSHLCKSVLLAPTSSLYDDKGIQCDMGTETLINCQNKELQNYKFYESSTDFKITNKCSDDDGYEEKRGDVGHMNNDAGMNSSEDYNNDTCIIYVSKLKELFKYCMKCRTTAVRCSKIKCNGSMITVNTECLDGCHYIWNSQPTKEGVPIGNIAISSAIFLNSLSFCNMKSFAKILNLYFLTKSEHQKNILKYVQPVVKNHWINHRNYILAEEKVGDLPITLVGHSQYAINDKNASFHTFSMISLQSNKIIDLQVRQKENQDKDLITSCDTVITRLESSLGDKFGSFLSQRHAGIDKLMSNKYKIKHGYDTWHIIESFEKKLSLLCKKKHMEQLLLWKESIINHVWYCVATSEENNVLLVEKLVSILLHIRGIHSWQGGVHINQCEHKKECDTDTVYLSEDCRAYEALRKLILNPEFVRDLKSSVHNSHTSLLDNYNKLKLKYLPKGSFFPFEGIVLGSILAALHNNYSTKSELVESKLVYSKTVQDYVWKSNWKDNKLDQWLCNLHADILDLENIPKPVEYESEFSAMFSSS